jgi:hypothetical protein
MEKKLLLIASSSFLREFASRASSIIVEANSKMTRQASSHINAHKWKKDKVVPIMGRIDKKSAY